MTIPRIVDQSATDNVFTSRSRLSDDLLKGAKEIAEFLLGDSKQRRQIYHLAQNGRLPVFKIGATICARRSTLLTWIEEQESHGSDDHLQMIQDAPCDARKHGMPRHSRKV